MLKSWKLWWLSRQLQNRVQTEHKLDVQVLVALGRETVEDLLKVWKQTENCGLTAKQCIRALVQIASPESVPPLIEALHDAYDEVRCLAAEALAKFQDSRAVLPLVAALEDPFDRVRIEAARALGQLGDQRAVGPLVELSSDQQMGACSMGTLPAWLATG